MNNEIYYQRICFCFIKKQTLQNRAPNAWELIHTNGRWSWRRCGAQWLASKAWCRKMAVSASWTSQSPYWKQCPTFCHLSLGSTILKVSTTWSKRQGNTTCKIFSQCSLAPSTSQQLSLESHPSLPHAVSRASLSAISVLDLFSLPDSSYYPPSGLHQKGNWPSLSQPSWRKALGLGRKGKGTLKGKPERFCLQLYIKM